MEQDKIRLEGVLHYWPETGTEGGYWAFQDKRFIETNDFGLFYCTKCSKSWDKNKNPQEPLNCPFGKHTFKPLLLEQWSYEGLHVLKDGDHLTIFSKDHGGVVWSGKIKLKKYSSFTESIRTNGMWIHADQEGVKRETWAKWFLMECPAILIKNKPAK